MNVAEVFAALLARGFTHLTAYLLTAAHYAHLTGVAELTARRIVTDHLSHRSN